MEIVTAYKNDDRLRAGFIELTKRVFGLDLTGWYEAGFWQNDYIPYSVVEGGNIVSNVSVNVCNIKWKMRVHHLAQLGTVETDERFRGRGYSHALMEKVLGECDVSFEGTYLFAGEHMAPYYEQFGFRRMSEYQCRKKVNITSKARTEKIPMKTNEDRLRMVDIIQRRGQYGKFIMVNNPGLFMFYLTGSMADSVYYVPSAEAYVIADVNDDLLTIYAAFSDEKISLGEIISSFGSDIKHTVLAFTPENNTGFEIKKIESDDSVLLVRGDVFSDIGNERFMFPLIAQA